MRIEDQVCCVELSKKLKQIGVTKKSIFWHQDGEIWKSEPSAAYNGEEYYAAYTSGELLKILLNHFLDLCVINEIYKIGQKTSYCLADAAAELLFRALLNNSIKLEDVNRDY